MADVIIPNAGESVTSANVANWHVADGASVTKGQALVTLETDKVSSELEAEEDGVISILVPEGEEVDIGTVIANISAGRQAPAAAPVASAAPAAPAQPTGAADYRPVQQPVRHLAIL